MKYGFIGCGNMGGAIAKALCRQTADIMIADPSPNAKAMAEMLGAVYTDNETLVSSCDRVFLAVKCVTNAQEAVSHIAAHSTGHSEAIITTDPEAEKIFTSGVDSAAVYVNASTRFTDGGEFGLGCEMGISTQKLHARGPMGLAELCTYKYVITGDGHIR